MRLDKYISETTSLTRSQAKKALGRGDIAVDGEVVTKGTVKIDGQQVTYQGAVLALRGPAYLLLYKPAGYICSTVDESAPSVLRLLPPEYARLHCAGRLDLDTTGLVLLTDDGQWSHKIASPKKQCGKTYLVTLDRPLSPELVTRFDEGVLLNGEDKPTRPAQLTIIDTHSARLTIHEGKYHQVKRMFAAVGNHVVALHRERVGNIVLEDALEPGQWRELTAEEVASV